MPGGGARFSKRAGRRGLITVTLAVTVSSAVLAGWVPSAVAVPPPLSTASPSALVDTFVGTGVGGASVGSIDTFPGADMPFGMLQWSPDTTPDRTSGGGYAYKDSAISGFSLTHMSGPGCAVYGDIPILPTVGAVGADPAASRARFSHATEVASPGNYAVTVGRPPVRVELAVTTRTGLGRFSFPGTEQSNVLFKVADSAAGSVRSSVTVVGDREVDGSVVSGDFCDTSGDYRLFFAARFDRSFSDVGTWHGTTVEPGTRTSTRPGSGAYVSFASPTKVVEMQVGISFVSVADARGNIDAERPGWDVGALRRRDTATWNALLGRIRVAGGTVADERTFYSELYHSLLHPNVFDDANGDYIGFDDKVHRALRYTQYANFSLWDVYRSEVQLLAVVAPRQTSDMVSSLLADARQGGGLPKLPVANLESAQLNGDSADPFIASAYAFGARDFDVAAALADMVRGATDPGVKTDDHLERQDLAQYLAQGYVPADTLDLTSLTYTVGASETLEYAIDDSAIAQLAQAVGDTATAQTFLARAQSWHNLVDPATGYLAARRADGSLRPGPPSSGRRCRASARSGSKRATPSSTRGASRRTWRASSGPWGATPRFGPSSTPSSRNSTRAGNSPTTGPATNRRSGSRGSTTTPAPPTAPRTWSGASSPRCTGPRPTESRATTTWGRCRRGTCGRPWASTPRPRVEVSSCSGAPCSAPSRSHSGATGPS